MVAEWLGGVAITTATVESSNAASNRMSFGCLLVVLLPV
jgi:hypothetical protein